MSPIVSLARDRTVALAILLLALAAPATAEVQTIPAGPGEPAATAVAVPHGVLPALAVRTVAIVESQSFNSAHDMDAEWLAVATALGHNASIVGQTTLDDVANLATTDILVVSSGVIDLTAPRIATILTHLQNHGQVYLQGEYLCSYPNNQAFASLVASLGGSFATATPYSGLLEPMTVTGILATTPNVVPELPGYFYGCSGGGDATITPFLHWNEHDFGFIFTPPSDAHGHIIFTSDQDWARDANFRPTSVDMIENILTYLSEAGGVAVEGARWGDIKAMYR